VKEINSLMQKAQRYLKSAKLLSNDGDYESAVSRIYYAMFYAAQAALLTKKLTFSSHKGVISAFGENFVKTGTFPKDMGKELNRAFEKRQLGDYEYVFVIGQDEAKQLLISGKNFVDNISTWLNKNKI